MRIKKLLIAGALVLTAVGCVSAYTIYANTLNTTNKSVNNTTEDKSTTTEKQQTTVEKNKDVQDDNENVAKDIDNTSVNPTTETKKTTTSTEEDANDQEDSEPEYPDDADKTCSHVWAEKQLHMMKRMDIIGQLIAKNVELLKQSQLQKRIMKDSILQQK